MIEIRINKDVGSYEPKIVGPLTARQSVCVASAAPVCIGIYQALSPVLGVDVAGVLVAIPAALAWLFGWYKPYGMKTEQFIRSVFVNMVLAPTTREYRTEYRQHLPDSSSSQGKSQRHSQKTKYRVSREAIR